MTVNQISDEWDIIVKFTAVSEYWGLVIQY